MKPDKFQKRKKQYEDRAKVQITDEEFEKMLGRSRSISMVVMPICLIAGLAMAVEWPGRWVEPFGQVSSYLGWVVVVISGISLIRDVLKK